MNPVLNISEQELLDLVAKVLSLFKQIMAWLGILVLPEEGELPTDTTAVAEEG